MNVTSTLPTVCGSLHLAGRRLPEASLLSPVQTCSSRFKAAGDSPVRASAPVVWQSQIRGPFLNNTSLQPGILTDHGGLSI
jgi:hypothetical protein